MMTTKQQARYDQLTASAKRVYQYWRDGYKFSIEKSLTLAEASFSDEAEYQRLKKRWT